jgi:hypothetical protein
LSFGFEARTEGVRVGAPWESIRFDSPLDALPWELGVLRVRLSEPPAGRLALVLVYPLDVLYGRTVGSLPPLVQLGRVPYNRLRERLMDELDSPTLTAMPDGSVDRHCDVRIGIDADVGSTAELSDLLAEGRVGSVRLRPHAERPGGQAVNLAQEVHALGTDVTLYGCLDHPVHEDHPFRTVSMGTPVEIRVLEFEADAVFVADEAEETREWTFADLADAAERARRDLDADLTADGVALVNWVSFPGMSSVAKEIAERAGGVEGWSDAGGGRRTGRDRSHAAPVRSRRRRR